jgi:hypothetical protein
MADETDRTKDPGEAKSPEVEKKPFVDPITSLTLSNCSAPGGKE